MGACEEVDGSLEARVSWTVQGLDKAAAKACRGRVEWRFPCEGDFDVLLATEPETVY